jgi:hypothetical protein
MSTYPETTIIQGLARIQRERRLPPQAIPRPVHLVAGQAVDAVNVVLEGDILKQYRILDVAAFFDIRQAQKAAELIEVTAGQRIQFGQELARRGKGRRARTMLSPVEGQVVRIEDSRIIIQASERRVEIQAKVPGELVSVEPNAVQVVGNGAIIQCAWGNGQYGFSPYRFVPEHGFVGLSKLDVRISEYRHVVIISPAPINKGDLMVAQQQEVAGVVAPSMPSNLREFAMQLTFPVLLTEGFGQRRSTELIYTLLQSNMGRQAAFDAVVPDPWSKDRPEIVIPLPSGGTLPPAPALDQPVAVGARVRIIRAPGYGRIGEVVALPNGPQVVGSGLRLPCARVRLSDERVVVVPLANLELLGQTVGASHADQRT